MSVKKWTNVPGELVKEIDDSTPDLQEVLGIEYGELTISFVSTGYSDPGSMYGGPDGVGWPPEYDDERTVEYITLDNEPVDKALWDEIEGWLHDEIQEEEIDYWS
jgi:hypothetical protein